MARVPRCAEAGGAVQRVALVAAGKVATLLVSPSPLTDEDVAGIRRACEQEGFRYLLGPDQPATTDSLARIATATTMDELDAAVADD